MKFPTLVIVLFVVLITPAYSQSFVLEGEVEKPSTISMTDFEKLPMIEVKGKDKDGKEHVFKGATLFSVIQSAGIPTGSKSFLKYIQVTAADNYKVIFAFAEIDPDFTSQSIIVATSVDGKPLSKEEGPFRIVVPNDKKHARWVRQVTAIKVQLSK
jgi:DMSO/TMAO reductase YedYZ molybdopterin-dependent catalytic subunit